MSGLFNINEEEMRKDTLTDLQDNLYTMDELTNEEGKKIVSKMIDLLNKLYKVHENDFLPPEIRD